MEFAMLLSKFVNEIRIRLTGLRNDFSLAGYWTGLATLVPVFFLLVVIVPAAELASHPGEQIWTAYGASPSPLGKPVTVVYELAPSKFHRIKSQYDSMILKVARNYGIDPALVKAIVHAESAFNSDAISHRGAMGLMQLMPETASRFKVSDPMMPQENVQAGVQYLRHLLEIFDWDLRLALAAYNAGPNAVRQFDRVPPYRETQGYVRKVIGLHELYALTL
jgi:soluble lytic murein transglycosylase-like protein